MAKRKKGRFVRGLIGFGVWYATAIGVFLAGHLLGLTSSEGLLSVAFRAVVLVVPVVVAVKVAAGKKPSSENTPKPTETAAPKEVEERVLEKPVEKNAVATEPEPQEEKPTTKTQTYKVAGVTHYEDAIMAMAVPNSLYDSTKRDLMDMGEVDVKVWKYEFYPSRLELEPEPDNPEDPNAIKVIVDGNHVGYIKKGSCKHLLKLMEKEAIVGATCQIGGGPYKMVVSDYDYDRDKETFSLERDEAKLFVRLEITEKL